MLLSSLTIFDREDSTGERGEHIGSLKLAMWIRPKLLPKNSEVGLSENPIGVMQDAAKAHRPLDKVIALSEASLKAIKRVGDKVHISWEAIQIWTRSNEVVIEIADCGAMSAGRGTGQGNSKRFGITRATKYLRSDRLKRSRLK